MGNGQRKRWGMGILKVTVAALLTFGIGTALVTFGPDGTVPEAEADVWDLSLFERSNTQKFASSLKRLGHEAPRSYDVNGNKVFFSVRATNKRPLELVEEYQRTFVEEGLNTEMYGFEERASQRAKRAMGGQIVPFKMDRDIVTMGGVVIPDSPSSVQEWESVKEGYRSKTLHDAFVGYRHIQADWDPDKRQSFVTASWSDEDFDMRRMTGEDSERMPESDDVPICVGCKRMIRWETDTRDIPNTVHVIHAPSALETVAHFYGQAMPADGWTLSGTTANHRGHLTTRLLEFTRGERRMQLTLVASGPRKTRVTAMELE